MGRPEIPEIPATARRKFLSAASALGAASLLPLPTKAAAEPPPETATIRLGYDTVICVAPMFLNEIKRELKA